MIFYKNVSSTFLSTKLAFKSHNVYLFFYKLRNNFSQLIKYSSLPSLSIYFYIFPICKNTWWQHHFLSLLMILICLLIITKWDIYWGERGKLTGKLCCVFFLCCHWHSQLKWVLDHVELGILTPLLTSFYGDEKLNNTNLEK